MYWTCNNNRYIGSWRDDLKHGKGNYRWSTGNRYNGDYYDDKPHGSGVYSTVHGDNYVGKFTNGLFQGKTALVGSETCVACVKYEEISVESKKKFQRFVTKICCLKLHSFYKN